MLFTDRRDGGRQLAGHLRHLCGRRDVVVVGLPRGGIPVADEVAVAIDAPLDVIVVRKLGVPYQPELAMGAIGEDDVRVINDDVVRAADVSPDQLAAVEERERPEVTRRAERFRQGRPRISLARRTVVVVDDGVATGSTARAACEVARAEGATHVTLAVPVAPAGWTTRLAGSADAFVAVDTPSDFYAVGQFYRDFSQTTDAEVVAILDRAATRSAGAESSDDDPIIDEDVDIRIDEAIVTGHLMAPEEPRGLVVFAHGSGSSRHSSRNRYVASVLDDAGIATLLFDLLTPDEERSRSNVFDIDLLAHRMVGVVRWTRTHPRLGDLPIAYFGASTGAAAALWAAAESDEEVAAVVSRGGRPDLAGARLPEVRAPTLLVVGELDTIVLDLNRRAREEMTCPSELVIVAGATHLFEEPGTLQQAAEAARDWFLRHFAQTTPAA